MGSGELRGQLQWRSLQLDPVPKRQPFGAHHRRLRAGGPAGRGASGRRAWVTGAGMRAGRGMPSGCCSRMAECAWHCGDQGVQYDTTINQWHTCPNSGRINASNPCSEYMFLDDTACNLASINLVKFRGASTARSMWKRFGGLPRLTSSLRRFWSITPAIRRRISPRIAICSGRWGLGYSNLGSVIMSSGCRVRLRIRPMASAARSPRCCMVRPI